MREAIGCLCALSILCGLAQSLCPEGSGKRALSFVCAVVLLAGAAKELSNLDWESYALESGRLRKREEEFVLQNEEVLRSLDRTVIEREYAAYIMDTAYRQGLAVSDVQVTAQWSLEGLWLPYSARLEGSVGLAGQEALKARIEADLGIPGDRIAWRQDGE